jgi:hypothetical protein
MYFLLFNACGGCSIQRKREIVGKYMDEDVTGRRRGETVHGLPFGRELIQCMRFDDGAGEYE